jgi:hypothetical protein
MGSGDECRSGWCAVCGWQGRGGRCQRGEGHEDWAERIRIKESEEEE